MARSKRDLPAADKALSDDTIIPYDNDHLLTYLRLLDADAEGTDWTEAARIVLGMDPEQEPERTRAAWESYLERAKWMTSHGYKDLIRGGVRIDYHWCNPAVLYHFMHPRRLPRPCLLSTCCPQEREAPNDRFLHVPAPASVKAIDHPTSLRTAAGSRVRSQINTQNASGSETIRQMGAIDAIRVRLAGCHHLHLSR
jgi:hypothetical protein